MERYEMKRKLVAFVDGLCALSTLAARAHAVKPVKTPNPAPPGQSKPECIVFADNRKDLDVTHGWAARDDHRLLPKR
jgi:hypothetical protein